MPTKKLSNEEIKAKNPGLNYFTDDEGALGDEGENGEVFTGDLTQSKILEQTNRNHGKGDFQYSWVFDN